MEKQYYLGIDIGSTTLKAVLLTARGKVHHTLYRRTKPLPDAQLSCTGLCHRCGACNLGAIGKIIHDFLAASGVREEAVLGTVVTGSQIVDELHRFVRYDAYVSEVSAHVAGARHYYPECKAILDVGGQDSKAMLYHEGMGMWQSKMSGICAAGTGAFLDSVAAKLNIPVEEMAERVNYDSELEVSSICAVLSATSVNKFKNRYPIGDVIAAACRAQARTVMSGVGELFLNYKGDIVFQGGVAANRAVVYYLHEITGNTIVVPEFHQVMGALGAACLAREYVEGKTLRGGWYVPRVFDQRARFRISLPEFHEVVEAINDQGLKREVMKLKDKLTTRRTADGKTKLGIPDFQQIREAVTDEGLRREVIKLFERLIHRAGMSKAVALRTQLTRSEFLTRDGAPLVWRNLFFPAEILNALGVRMLTLETYAALRGRNQKKLRYFFDRAACKGFSAETCSFLRVLEGDEYLPRADFAVTTTEPCQQGERIFADLVRTHGIKERCYTLHTPFHHDENAIEHIAEGLEESVRRMERALGLRMDMGRLREVCERSNEAREWALKVNQLRYTSPPLLRGAEAILFANIFSQLWGKAEMVQLQKTLYEELLERKEDIEHEVGIHDTHRLLWLHLPPFYGTRLLDFIELTCNAPIVFEEVNFVGWDALDPNDPYRSLARKLLTVGFLDPQLRVKHICDDAHNAHLNGCILYNHMFGRCSMADSSFIKHLREELQALGIPLLVLDGDCLDETTDPCSTFTKVSAFVEALNLKRYGSIFGGHAERGGRGRR
ncbi:MAG: 2-hydroxyacyl-CoA dehydratase [bacterium]|nr:2-hydroxyacyl-CoA dehydratase [bacterium]